jgi:hypothetical protein
MSTAAKFSNNVEISGNVDISGNINIDGTLTVDGSFSLYGYHIPDPNGENNKVLTISGDGYSWETVEQGDEEINTARQTFYEIITEQPRAFTSIDKNGSSFENTTSSIDISWSFDNIIPFDDTTGDQKILNINDDMITKVLPCITKIHFDISSTISDSGSVSNAFCIDVDTTDNYYIHSKSNPGQGDIVSGRLTYIFNYNGLTLINSGSDFNTYTINVWGENDSNGTNTFYKLTYTNLKFKSSGIPETPAITNTSIDTQSDLINFTIDISISDLDIDNSDTELDGSIYIEKVDLSYSLIGASSELLRSSFYGDGDHAGGTEIIDTNYNSGIIHTILDDTGTEDLVKLEVKYEENFYFGAKYDLQLKVKNNLAEDDTSYSSISTTSYTDIPDSDGVSIDTFSGNSLILRNENNLTSGLLTNIINMDAIYLYNLAQIESNNNLARILPSYNNGIRTIEISDPNKTKTTDTTGFRKYIDGSINLVTITCNLERSGVNSGVNVSLQQLSYHGWNSSSPYTSFTSIANYSENGIEPFTNESIEDMYSSNGKKGFRIKGSFKTENHKLLIKDLSNAQLVESFEASGNTGYVINYNYDRQDGNSVTTDVSSNSFFVDNFTNYADPSYNTESSTVTVTGISWVMGIPQVSTVDISFARNHININSEYKYFQSDGLVAKVNSIKANGSTDVYSSVTKDYLYLTYSDLNTDGSYNGSFDGSQNYSNITSSQINNTVSSLVVNTYVYNLYTTQTYDETFNVAHYRDVTSISNYSSVFKGNIYEINDSCYNYLGNDGSKPFLSLHDNETGLINYTDDTKEIELATSAFINGYFTANTSDYPNIVNFNYDNMLDSYNNYTFTYRNTGLNIATDTVETDSGPRYKAIVYKVITDTTDDSYDSSEFVNTDAGTLSVINLSVIIDKLFGATILSSVTSAMLSDTTFRDDLLIYSVANAPQSNGSNVPCVGIINDGKFTNFIDLSFPWYTLNTATSTKSFEELTGFNSTSGQSSGGALISEGTSPNRTDCCNNAGFSSTYTASDGNSYSTFVGHANRDIADLNKYYLYFFLKI